MRIELSLNGNPYAIEVDGYCFTAIKVIPGAEKDPFGNPSKNAGILKDNQLDYFSKLENAAKRLCREELACSPDVVSLQQFAARVEALNKQMLDQLAMIEV